MLGGLLGALAVLQLLLVLHGGRVILTADLQLLNHIGNLRRLLVRLVVLLLMMVVALLMVAVM